MKKILLKNTGNYTLVDDDTFALFSSSTWYEHGGYARRNRNKKVELLSRLVLGITDQSVCVDHIDRNRLDNRRCNLRLCTRAVNRFNSGTPKTNTSGYSGVHWNKRLLKWQVYIGHNPKVYLGLYKNLKDAVEVRNKAALARYGEYAVIQDYKNKEGLHGKQSNS